MNQLEELRQSISNMTDEELVNHFREIRLRRRRPRKPTKKAASKAKTTKAKSVNPSNISKDKVAELLALFEGAMK